MLYRLPNDVWIHAATVKQVDPSAPGFVTVRFEGDDPDEPIEVSVGEVPETLMADQIANDINAILVAVMAMKTDAQFEEAALVKLTDITNGRRYKDR